MTSDINESLVIKKSIYREPVLSHSLNLPGKQLSEEYYKMDPKLSLSDIVSAVKSQFVKNHTDITKALQTFDLENTGIVTKGELRRVLDLYCLPMTTNQYDSLLSHNLINIRNGSVNYCEVMDKIQGKSDCKDENTKLPLLGRAATTLGLQTVSNKLSIRSNGNPLRSHLSSSNSSRNSTSRQSSRSWNYNAYSIDEIVPILQMQIARNPTAILKAFKLFDFNSDHYIQRHRLKKVFENFCCPLSDQQFDKLLMRFSHSQTGNVNYMDLMNSLGIPIDSKGIVQSKVSNKVTIDTRVPDDSRVSKLAMIGNGLLGSSELEELLIIFRKKVELQFSALRKAFLVMDPNAEGFVDLDVLHQILNQFVFPMSANVFTQLMEKSAFKATGKIVWLQFLQKFQDPQSKKLNGSTMAIKSDNRCNPIQGVNNKGSLDVLLELLCKHINNNYSSFREAFLQMNKTHKGKIPRNEFIKILTRFQFQISGDQINMILTFLDPNNRGFVSYHHFLELFEQKEKLSAHKWLNSNHKVIEPRKDLQLSADTIKSTITENIVKKWPNVVQEFKAVDVNRSGFISVIDLKKIFAKLFGYLKEDDVDRLIAPLTLRDAKGRMNYLELFNILDVDSSPDDINGLSTQITEGNDLQMKERHENHMDKMSSIGKIAEARVNSMSIDELVVRMKDRLLQNRTNYFEIFKKYECQDKKGGISKSQLRKMINDFGFSSTKEQFQNLCSALNFPNNSGYRLDFNGFLTIFLDNRQNSDDLNGSSCFLPQTNHHVNVIRGEENQNMGSLDIEELLRQKIVNNFSDLKSAFHKFDSTNKGYLNKSDFRNFLITYLIMVDDVQFNSMCDKLGIENKAKLTYNDFLDRFQIRDDMVNGHKWLDSNHKFNDSVNSNLPEMTCEEVYKLLPDKIYQAFQTLTPSFTNIVTNGTGFIRFKNLLQLLRRLQINISKEETKNLWKRYDIHSRNKLDFHDFLNNMGLLEKFSCGDIGGPSATIIQNSHDSLVDHLADQEIKHQKAVDNQALLGNHLHVEHLFETIKRHLRVTYQDTKTAFKAITSKKSLSGYFSLDDLNRLLSHIHLFVTNEKFLQLAARMGFQGPDDALSYESLCEILQDQINISGQERPIGSIINNCDVDKPSKIVIDEAGNLNHNQIAAFISKKITDQYSEIEKTFLVMDPDNSGFVTVNELRNLLTAFCLKLTDKQFQKYLNFLSCYLQTCENSDNKLDYRYFLKQFNEKENASMYIGIELPSTDFASVNANKMNFGRIQEYINESIKTRPKLFLNAFKQKDYAFLKHISKSDLRDIIEQYTFKLSNQDFDKFWTLQNKNEFDNIDYCEFIKSISGYSENDAEKVSKSLMAKEKYIEHTNPVESNEDDEEQLIRAKLENLLNKHWQNIFSKCKALDHAINETQPVEGSITIEDFICILSEYDNTLSKEKLASMNLYKTCRNGRNIRYGDLIRSVVLSSRGSLITQENAADIHKKFVNVGIKTTNADKTKDYFPQLFKLRRHILENWKTLRKQFLQNDKKQNGTITGNLFMTTIKTICGQLSADLFYHLMKSYDYEGTGDFHYKRFLEDFLKSA